MRFGISEDEAVTKVATSAANWLKIDNGVRGISMGGSQVASGRGLSGVYYNPASIAFIKRSEVFILNLFTLLVLPIIHWGMAPN